MTRSESSSFVCVRTLACVCGSFPLTNHDLNKHRRLHAYGRLQKSSTYAQTLRHFLTGMDEMFSRVVSQIGTIRCEFHEKQKQKQKQKQNATTSLCTLLLQIQKTTNPTVHCCRACGGGGQGGSVSHSALSSAVSLSLTKCHSDCHGNHAHACRKSRGGGTLQCFDVSQGHSLRRASWGCTARQPPFLSCTL